jgi:3-hydroxybutyryl-CoA dehydrogenase
VDAVGIVGAGFMGSGIAESAMVAGLRALVYEPDGDVLEPSRERIAGSLEQAVDRGTLDSAAASDALARSSFTTTLEDLLVCELVIEAVTEDQQVKADVFRQLDAAMPGDAILASNTSSIPIANLAAATRRPGRVLGLHFFSPVPAMRLVEIVPALTTDPEAVNVAEAFVRRIGKQAIRCKDRAGFVVNVLLIPYLIAAIRLYEEGVASREDIDEAMTLGCRHPMGPLALCDLIGLDVIEGICASLYEEHKRDEYAAPPLLRRMVTSGHLGRKSGHGFYDHTVMLARSGARS